MTDDSHFNIPIDRDIRSKFKAKYPGMAGERAVELIKEDLGISKSQSELDRERVGLEQQLEPIKKRLEEIREILSHEKERKDNILHERKEEIRELFTNLRTGSLNLPDMWEDSDDPAPRISVLGLEGYTRGDVWRVLNE